ncbi:MAG: hydrogenase iron-sulfur subunit [Candidatus Schekmanbacteria bacterium]|nr:hydrogenase iron-sulfur subunit [Candidatus Schekmanbacteria bacterium]
MSSTGAEKQADVRSIVAFCCNHSGFEAYESACRELKFSDDFLKIVKVPCSGKVDIQHILRVFEKGAAAVMVFACYRDNCKYIHGNVRAEKRMEDVKLLLGEIGIDAERVAFCNVASNTPHRVTQAVIKMRETINRLGPLTV